MVAHRHNLQLLNAKGEAVECKFSCAKVAETEEDKKQGHRRGYDYVLAPLKPLPAGQYEIVVNSEKAEGRIVQGYTLLDAEFRFPVTVTGVLS